MFYEPTCGRGGVQVVDITDPANPKAGAYVPSHVDTYSGEGSQVVTLDTPAFKGDLLVYQNEWCPQSTNGVGGITLVDVTNPRQPKKLVEGAGDFTKKDGSQSGGVPQTKANQTHSAFAWEQRDAAGRKTGRVYVVLVDDLEEPDVDILDISNPSKPKLVSETNLDQFAPTGPTRPHGDAVFSHDMIVKHIGGRDMMLMSYWDGGYVTTTGASKSTGSAARSTSWDPIVTAACGSSPTTPDTPARGRSCAGPRAIARDPERLNLHRIRSRHDLVSLANLVRGGQARIH